MFLHECATKIKIRLIIGLVLLGGLLSVTGLASLRTAYAAFPTNSGIIDNFNSTNTTTIAGRTSSSGATWSTNMINSSNQNFLGISSNQLTGSNGANGYITTSYGPDTELYTDITTTPPLNNGSYIALFARIQNPGSSSFSAYALVYIHGASSSWSLRRYNSGGGFTQLKSISTAPISSGNSIGVDVTGTGSTVTITAYQKVSGTWNTIGSATDATANRITLSGKIGVEGGDSTNTLRMDNLGGGTIINNTSPAAPTLSLPANNSTDVSTTPQFQLRSTDANSDYLRYKIEVCSDAACTNVVRTIDQTSSQTGWSGQDQQSSTAYAGSTTLTSSTLATHTYQAPALSAGTQYWWRAYAIDPGGTNAFSVASAISSFTTAAAASTPGGSTSGSGTPSSSGPASTSGTTASAKDASASNPYWGK